MPHPSTPPLADQDRALLRLLQADGKLTVQDLAERAGMSTSACWRRVKQLEESGLLSGYVARVDRARAGFAIAAMVHVVLARHEAGVVDRFAEHVRDRPEILECLKTTGEADFHLKIVSTDLASYNRLLEDFLFRLPGVAQVRSYIVLDEIKVDGPLPL